MKATPSLSSTFLVLWLRAYCRCFHIFGFLRATSFLYVATLVPSFLRGFSLWYLTLPNSVFLFLILSGFRLFMSEFFSFQDYPDLVDSRYAFPSISLFSGFAFHFNFSILLFYSVGISTLKLNRLKPVLSCMYSADFKFFVCCIAREL